MSVEGPISSVHRISPRKKPPMSKLASILDGQVNGLTFLLNNIPCRLSVLPDGRHWRQTLTVAKFDDCHWRPSLSVVKNGARQWRPTVTAVTVGRHWRLVCTGLQWRPSNEKALQCNAFSFDGRHWRPTCRLPGHTHHQWRPSLSAVRNGDRQWRPSLSAVIDGSCVAALSK